MPRDFFLHEVKYFTIFLANFWEIVAAFFACKPILVFLQVFINS